MNNQAMLKKRGVQIFAAMGVFLITVGIFMVTKKPKNEDRRTGCPNKITRETVIVLDRSSEVSLQTKEEISNRIKNIIDRKVQVGERITIYEVNDDAYTNLRSIDLSGKGLDFCKPRDKAENALIDNVSLVHTIYESRIKKILASEVINSRGKDSKSPIAQVVFDASLSKHMLVDKKFDKDKRVSFYLFSDLMENSKDLSVYSCSNGENAISKFKQSRMGRTSASDSGLADKDALARPMFKNIANFEVHLVPTHQSEGTLKCRNKFWNWYFGILEFSEDVPKEDQQLIITSLPG